MSVSHDAATVVFERALADLRSQLPATLHERLETVLLTTRRVGDLRLEIQRHMAETKRAD